MTTRPTDPRGASRRGATDKEDTMYRIEVYHDDDNGWCAEITVGRLRQKGKHHEKRY